MSLNIFTQRYTSHETNRTATGHNHCLWIRNRGLTHGLIHLETKLNEAHLKLKLAEINLKFARDEAERIVLERIYQRLHDNYVAHQVANRLDRANSLTQERQS